MFDTSKKAELKNRVESRKREIEADLERLKADARSSANEGEAQIVEKIDSAKKQLADYNEMMKQGWDELTEGAAAKINDWLSRTDSSS